MEKTIKLPDDREVRGYSEEKLKTERANHVANIQKFKQAIAGFELEITVIDNILIKKKELEAMDVLIPKREMTIEEDGDTIRVRIK